MALSSIRNAVYSRYMAKFPISGQLHTAARKVLPGGNTKQVSFHKPYPVSVARGQGATLYTEDGVELIDFVSAYGVIVLGHGDPDIEAAATRAMKSGLVFGTPATIQVEYAKSVSARFPAAEKIRLATTGTEAVTFALQAAKRYTNRSKVVLFHGGFHGTGFLSMEQVQSQGVGRYKVEKDEVIVLPWNDSNAVLETLQKEGDQIACVLMEPFLGAGGVIEAFPEFVDVIKRETKSRGVLWILDEITSARCAYRGFGHRWASSGDAPSRFPDMTLLGKLVGGGFPIAVIGGSAEVMKIFDCYEVPQGRLVQNSGSYLGHSVPCATGLTAINKCDEAFMTRIATQGAYLASKLREFNKERQINVQIHNIGPLLNIHFNTKSITTFSEKLKSDFEITELMHLCLMNEGCMCLPRLMIFVSGAHATTDMDAFVAAYQKAMETLTPLLRERGFMP